MERPALSQRARRRLLIAALLGAGGYAAHRAWREDTRLRRTVRSATAELQRCVEAALTRATACVVAGTVRGIASVQPEAVEAITPNEPWQAAALEKLLGILTTRAGRDLVSLAVAVGAQHSVAAFCQHWNAQQAAAGAAVADLSARQQEQQARGQPREQLGRVPPAMPQPLGNPIVAQLLNWAGTKQGEKFVVAAMASAAQHSTRAYMDSLGGGNTYDDLFAAAFRPENRDVLRDLTVMATREAVATYLCPPSQHRVNGSATHPGRQQAHKQGTSWSALQTAGAGASFLVRQVSGNSRAAAVAIPLVVLASSRGIALGCRDALARLRQDASGELLGSSLRSWLLEGLAPRAALWLLCSLAAVVLCVLGLRQAFWRDAALAVRHAA